MLPNQPKHQHILAATVPTFRDRPLYEYIDIGDSSTSIDAFRFYSNDEIRMRTLSGGILGAAHDHEHTVTEETRKTRLSFELHPSVLFEDLSANDDVPIAEEGNNHAIDDRNMNNENLQSELAALVSLLYGYGLEQ